MLLLYQFRDKFLTFIGIFAHFHTVTAQNSAILWSTGAPFDLWCDSLLNRVTCKTADLSETRKTLHIDWGNRAQVLFARICGSEGRAALSTSVTCLPTRISFMFLSFLKSRFLEYNLMNFFFKGSRWRLSSDSETILMLWVSSCCSSSFSMDLSSFWKFDVMCASSPRIITLQKSSLAVSMAQLLIFIARMCSLMTL